MGGWRRRVAAEATDYELADGRGVYVDPVLGPVVGRIVEAPTGPYVAPTGRHTRDAEGDDFITEPAPDGWQAQVVRGWRG